MLCVVLFQHLAELFHVLALAFLLRKLAHIDFGKVTFDSVIHEGLIGFCESARWRVHRLRDRIHPGKRQGCRKAQGNHSIAVHAGFPCSLVWTFTDMAPQSSTEETE